MKTTKPEHFLVIYDDRDCIRIPYGWDDDCPGAIRGSDDEGPYALFPSRKAAQQAIRISTAYAKLCVAQGKPVNEDFTTSRKNIRIVPACFAGRENP